MITENEDTIGTFVSGLKHLSQTTVSLVLEDSSKSHVAVAGFDASEQDNRSLLMLAGEDIPWVLKYVSANKEEALLCILFSLAVGLCFILLSILFCLCCRWKKAKSKGSFTIAKQNGEGGARVSSYASTGNKETEGLLNSGTMQSSSGGRTYSSPRLIRAEYARAAAISSGGGNTTTSSSTSNANVVGLYLSQAPKSRWSRASDATVWPLPPGSADGEASLSTITRTLPMHERASYITSPGSISRTAATASTLSPPLVSLLSQNNQCERQTLPPHLQIHSSFATASPTDYLFNRQSVIMDPRVAAPTSSSRITGYVSPNIASLGGTDTLLRKPPMDEGLAQRKAMSYQGGSMSGPSYHHQHHSYIGPSHPTSPPILPAPASSPWPTRNSQMTLDQQETVFAGTRDRD